VPFQFCPKKVYYFILLFSKFVKIRVTTAMKPTGMVLQEDILHWCQLSESQAQLRRQEMYYAPRQDIGSESDRTQCEEALNSRYLHWLSSSIQHTAFLAISKIQCFRRNKNNIRIFCCTASWEHKIVIVDKNFISSHSSNKISSLKSDLQICVLNV